MSESPSGQKVMETMIAMKDFFDQRGVELNYDAALIAGLLMVEMDENKKLRQMVLDVAGDPDVAADMLRELDKEQRRMKKRNPPPEGEGS